MNEFAENPYAQRNRERKAAAIAAALHACNATPARALQLAQSERNVAAKLAGQRAPSAETWRQAVATLRELRRVSLAADITTGYYGIPGTMRVTAVHLHQARRGPLCGSRLSVGMVFQWCAHGAYLSYVECARCRAQWLRLVEGV